jgi:hypothetical protein
MVGLGNDDRPFRVLLGSTPEVLLPNSKVFVGGSGEVRGAAFTTLAAEMTLPALAFVRGNSSDHEINSFEVAIPSGDGYSPVVVEPAPKPCPPDPQCASSCTEENIEVSPKDIALAWDGTRAFLTFLRRHVTRQRRYKREQGSGIICDFLGCDPYCTSDSSGTVKSTDLVIATLDLSRRTVSELFELPIEPKTDVVAGAQSGQISELRAYAHAGYLHVAFGGKYQGQFDGVSVYRFRIAP